MPMTRAGNQEEVGEKLFFFRSSRPNEARCVIFAHGGQLSGDGDFQLQNGVTLTFFQKEHGKALKSNPWRGMFGGKPTAANLETFTGPTRVTNYSLGKGVGDHWKDENTTITYEQIETQMGKQLELAKVSNWTPHIVTVRRRFRGMGRLIKLADAIPAITQHCPAVTEIYIAACRGDALKNAPVRSFFVRI